MASGSSAAPLDCIRGISHYVSKILKPRDKTKEISGMKCLLLDRESKTLVSMVYSMNDILSKEVFLVDSLDAEHAGTGHMKVGKHARAVGGLDNLGRYSCRACMVVGVPVHNERSCCAALLRLILRNYAVVSQYLQYT